MTNLTVEQIESIEFYPIGMGQYPYRLKFVEVNHPAQNVAGYTRIGDNYYKQVYDMRTQPPIRRSSGDSISKILGIGKIF